MQRVTSCRTKAGPAVGAKEMKAQTASRAQLAIFEKLVNRQSELELHGIGTYQ